MKYRVRFNKTRGMSGRGTVDHVWRVLDENNREYLCKNIIIDAPSRGEIDPQTGSEWNITSVGVLVIDRETSTITIRPVDNIS